MKKLLTITLCLLSLCLSISAIQDASAQSATKNTATKTTTKRGPVFRATKEQIKQAQAILKGRGFYSGEQTGTLDAVTRDGLRDYQKAEGLKITGTLNRSTLEKMSIPLTDKQQSM